ncbi:unnamed protein product, partial [Prunus brigantina]
GRPAIYGILAEEIPDESKVAYLFFVLLQLFLDFGRDGVSTTKESSLMSTTFSQAD